MPTVDEYLLQYGVGNMTSKYLYATCEPFNRYRHGYDGNSSYNIEEYQLIIDTHISYNGLIIAEYWLNNRNQRHMRFFGKKTDAKIHLVEPVLLEGGELVAIIKTMWISILQRRWRRIYNERKRKITKYLQLKNLRKRETGINR
jgi:hypothetical protein